MELLYITIKYKNTDINILQFISESNNEFNKRLEYIKKLELNNIDYTEVINLSMLWHCIKFKKCKYNINIQNRVLSFDRGIL